MNFCSGNWRRCVSAGVGLYLSFDRQYFIVFIKKENIEIKVGVWHPKLAWSIFLVKEKHASVFRKSVYLSAAETFGLIWYGSYNFNVDVFSRWKLQLRESLTNGQKEGV